MKQNNYYQLKAVLCALTGIMFMSVAEYHIICGIMAVVCLACTALFANEYECERDELFELRSNADEDRPE